MDAALNYLIQIAQDQWGTPFPSTAPEIEISPIQLLKRVVSLTGTLALEADLMEQVKQSCRKYSLSDKISTQESLKMCRMCDQMLGKSDTFTLIFEDVNLTLPFYYKRVLGREFGFLRGLLEGGMSESVSKEVSIPEVSARDFYALLLSCFDDLSDLETTITSLPLEENFENLWELLQLADRFGGNDLLKTKLLKRIDKVLSTTINVEEIFDELIPILAQLLPEDAPISPEARKLMVEFLLAQVNTALQDFRKEEREKLPVILQAMNHAGITSFRMPPWCKAAELKLLAEFPVTELDLSFIYWEELSFDFLKGMPLRKLVLKGTEVTSHEVIRILSTCKFLEGLDISEMEIDLFPIVTFLLAPETGPLRLTRLIHSMTYLPPHTPATFTYVKPVRMHELRLDSQWHTILDQSIREGRISDKEIPDFGNVEKNLAYVTFRKAILDRKSPVELLQYPGIVNWRKAWIKLAVYLHPDKLPHNISRRIRIETEELLKILNNAKARIEEQLDPLQ